MKAILRWVALVLLGFAALQLFFVGRIATMAFIDPQSTTFQRSEAWRIATEKHRLPWRQRWLTGRIMTPTNLEDVAKHTLSYPIKHGARVRQIEEDQA